jgi:dTDP-4-dehydrorhamnose reductase
VLLCGANGQLGAELRRAAPAWARLEATDRASLDISDAEAVLRLVERTRPRLILNAAAYTAVERAEDEREAAFAVNAKGPQNLARAAAAAGAKLVHVSTDYVFDGTSRRPYRPQDPVAPLGAYGASKAEGEKGLGAHALVIRSSWLYGAHGANFVSTMLRLMREREELRVVADQVGSPTWSRGLAAAIWLGAEHSLTGIHHYSDAGETTWHGFAVAILEEARALGMELRARRVIPIASSDYPSKVRRPAYSVLDCSGLVQALGIALAPWRDNLRRMLSEIRGQSPISWNSGSEPE